jgi:hypothetical protein
MGMALSLVLVFLGGCDRFHPRPKDYVYVSARGPLYLRDRVAPVSNHTAQVVNGERLQVLEHARRFLKVQTAQGAVGWIEAPAVIDQKVYDGFVSLQKDHAQDPVIAHAILRDPMYMHLAPGVKSEHFYLIPADTKLEMLARVSSPRNTGTSTALLPKAPAAATPHALTTPRAKRGADEGEGPQVPMPPVPMDDWWLVRDATGRTGWMLGRRFDLDVPDEVAQYAEGQRMVAAYVLRTVPDTGPDGVPRQVPEYLTVLTPYKDGLPYDFDQVRVFTWDSKRHHYGTAFRQRDLVGYFPVTVEEQGSGGRPGPEFSLRVAADNALTVDPATGAAHPVQLEVLTYRMEGNMVRSVLLPGEKTPARGAKAKVRKARQHTE